MGFIVFKNKMKREWISKWLRFDILSRDWFSCVYCGAKAPEVLLEIDHILPVSKGGKNDIANLCSACRPCNSGKRAKNIEDKKVWENITKAVEDMKEKEKQLKEYYKYLNKKKDKFSKYRIINELYKQMTGGKYTISENWMKSVKSLGGKYGHELLVEALRISVERDAENLNMAYVGGICRNLYFNKEYPDWYKFYYQIFDPIDQKRGYLYVKSYKEYIIRNHKEIQEIYDGWWNNYDQEDIEQDIIEYKEDEWLTRWKVLKFYFSSLLEDGKD